MNDKIVEKIEREYHWLGIDMSKFKLECLSYDEDTGHGSITWLHVRDAGRIRRLAFETVTRLQCPSFFYIEENDELLEISNPIIT